MKSILGRLWLGITSLVIIIIVLIWIFQILFLNTFYMRERTNILVNKGNEIASLVEKGYSIDIISEEITNEIESFTSAFDATVAIISPSLELLYVRGNSKLLLNRLKLFVDTKIIRTIKSGKPFVTRRKIRQLDSTFITVGIPLKYNEKVIGSVILNTSVEPIQETISILRKQLTIITLISVCIGTILSLLLAKAFTKPVIKITSVAKKIAKGDFNSKVNIASEDEIGVLGNTINNLSTQLGQTEKFRKEFIANTSHELKTPISLIKAYAELIMECDNDEKENIHQHLNVITEESDKLNKMVEDMLYLSKMEAGYYNPKIKPFNIVEVTKKVISKLTCIADENNIKVSLDASSYNITINADEEKMEHVLLNLVNNAIVHSSADDEITVKITNLLPKVRIEVIDNGIGIPNEDLPYIWDRFYKVDKSRNRKSSGTGLGMSIVKNILAAHGFKYGIQSKLGKGTTVWFETRDK